MSQGDIYMAFEYMDADLAGILSTDVVLQTAHVRCIMQQIFQAFAVLHSKNIMHRDCKASNLLVSRHGVVKLADFGLATNYKTRDRFGCNVVTLWYRGVYLCTFFFVFNCLSAQHVTSAPELLLGDEVSDLIDFFLLSSLSLLLFGSAKRYGPAVDIWSIGCIFAETAIRRNLFPGRNETEQLELIYGLAGTPNEQTWPGVSSLKNYKVVTSQSSRLRDCAANHLPKEGIDLLEDCLTLSPTRRPT